MDDTINICSHCGTANPSEARFCIECGSGVGAATGATEKLPSKRCASCSGEAPPLARFCPLCGRSYESAAIFSAPPAVSAPLEQRAAPQAQPASAATHPRPALQIPWGMLALGLSLLLLVASRGRMLFFVAPLALGAMSLGLSRQAWHGGHNGRAVGLTVFWVGLGIALLFGKLWPGLLVVGLIALVASWLAAQIR